MNNTYLEGTYKNMEKHTPTCTREQREPTYSFSP